MNQRLVAVGTAVIATALTGAADLLVWLHHAHHWPHGFPIWLEGTVSLPVWLAIGLLLAYRVPGNVLGAVALTFAVLSGMQLFSGALATYIAGPHSAAGGAVDALAAVSTVAQMSVVGGIFVFTQLAPDGALVSTRWRVLLIVTVVALAAVAVGNLSDAMTASSGVSAASPPFSLPGYVRAALNAVSSVALVVVVSGTLAGIVVRWRRGTAVQRQQLKLVVYAAVTAALLGVVLQPIGNKLWPNAQLAGDITWTIIPSIIPASIAVAVLRYRLYDIDRVVSRTVTYAVVTGLVVGVYVGFVALIETVLGFSSSVSVAASTLAAAAAFQPLRRRVQRGIDRRFDRAAYDARRTVDRFSTSLRDEVDVDAVCDDLLTTVAFAVAPASASVWLVSA